MNIVKNLALAGALAAASLMAFAQAPAVAQNGVYSPQPSQLELECRNTRRLEICLQYHTLFCSQYGIPGACRLAQLGAACTNGDQNGCNYYSQIVNVGLDCEMGNQQACTWMRSQGF